MTLATSRNLTIVGICTMLGALANAAALLFDGDAATNPDWENLISLLITGITGLLAKGAKSTGGTVDAAGKPAKPSLPGAPVAVLLAFLAFTPFSAKAQEVPIGGGCLKNQTTCFGPSFGVALASLNLDTGQVDTTFAPGAGYGVTWFVGKWYETGIAGYGNLRPTDDGQRLVLSGVGTFAKYLRLGVGYQLGSKSQQKKLILFSFGSDFGRARE